MSKAGAKLLKQLHERPIEVLRLSPETMRVLKWHTITSLGHCAEYYLFCTQRLPQGSMKLNLLMFGEVAAQMKGHGSWRAVLDANLWAHVQTVGLYNLYSPRKKIALWQGQERDLYEVPLKDLGAPSAVPNLYPHHLNVTLGYCIDRYGQRLYLSRQRYEERRVFSDRSPSHRENKALAEVYFKLQEHGLWSYIEDQYDDP